MQSSTLIPGHRAHFEHCSLELGYPEDAIESKIINLVNGENFTPEFLNIVSYVA